MANKDNAYVRYTISVPKHISDRMRRKKGDYNWSHIASRTFAQMLGVKEPPPPPRGSTRPYTRTHQMEGMIEQFNRRLKRLERIFEEIE